MLPKGLSEKRTLKLRMYGNSSNEEKGKDYFR